MTSMETHAPQCKVKLGMTYTHAVYMVSPSCFPVNTYRGPRYSGISHASTCGNAESLNGNIATHSDGC